MNISITLIDQIKSELPDDQKKWSYTELKKNQQSGNVCISPCYSSMRACMPVPKDK